MEVLVNLYCVHNFLNYSPSTPNGYGRTVFVIFLYYYCKCHITLWRQPDEALVKTGGEVEMRWKFS
jgi:hypothetical protein